MTDPELTEVGLSLAVLITSHNRKATTIRCLKALKDAQLAAPCEITVVLVDNGSNDGTAEAVEAFMPAAQVVRASGDLYWAGGTRLAASEAKTACPQATHYVWLNDDVILDADSLGRMCKLVGESPGSVIVGAVRDPDAQTVTYSGLERRSFHPMRYSRVQPSAGPKPVETFNGNLVFIPVEVERLLGGIDNSFIHKYADLDYGHRATESGVPVVLAPGTFGTCPRNLDLGVDLGARDGWKGLTGPKGLPPKLQARFLRRHGGRFWPAFFPMPYLRFALAWLRGLVGRRP